MKQKFTVGPRPRGQRSPRAPRGMNREDCEDGSSSWCDSKYEDAMDFSFLISDKLGDEPVGVRLPIVHQRYQDSDHWVVKCVYDDSDREAHKYAEMVQRNF